MNQNDNFLTRRCSIIEQAASDNNWEIFEWLKENWFGWDQTAIDWIAINGGPLKTIQWLRSKGLEYNKLTLTSAISGRNLEIVKWIRQDGCPWDKWIFTWAVIRGSLDIIKWLKDNGCPYDDQAIRHAKFQGFVEIQQYLRDNDFPDWPH